MQGEGHAVTEDQDRVEADPDVIPGDADDAYDVMMMSYQELFEKSIVWGRQKVKDPVWKNI